LTGHDEGILYRRDASLSDEESEQVRQLVEAALAEIAQLAQILNLPVEIADNRSALWGKLAILGADLYEARAEKLGRYGETAPDLEMVLNPPLLRLIQTVNQIRSVLRDEADRYSATT